MNPIKPAWLLLLFTCVMLSGCQSMSEEDKWLWNSSTNAPPPSLQTPAK
jgi:hypothetical protein